MYGEGVENSTLFKWILITHLDQGVNQEAEWLQYPQRI